MTTIGKFRDLKGATGASDEAVATLVLADAIVAFSENLNGDIARGIRKGLFSDLATSHTSIEQVLHAFAKTMTQGVPRALTAES